MTGVQASGAAATSAPSAAQAGLAGGETTLGGSAAPFDFGLVLLALLAGVGVATGNDAATARPATGKGKPDPHADKGSSTPRQDAVASSVQAAGAVSPPAATPAPTVAATGAPTGATKDGAPVAPDARPACAGPATTAAAPAAGDATAPPDADGRAATKGDATAAAGPSATVAPEETPCAATAAASLQAAAATPPVVAGQQTASSPARKPLAVEATSHAGERAPTTARVGEDGPATARAAAAPGGEGQTGEDGARGRSASSHATFADATTDDARRTAVGHDAPAAFARDASPTPAPLQAATPADAPGQAAGIAPSHAEPAPAETAAPRDALPSPSDWQADVERLVRQQSGAVHAMRDGSEMRLRVDRDDLGQIEVRVAVHDQAVHATLVTEHDHARDALVASRPSLEAALGRSNLRLEGFTVGLGQHQQGRAGRDNDDGRPAAATPGHPAPAPAATPSPDRPEADLGAGALSVRV